MNLESESHLKGTFYIILSSFFFGSQGVWARVIGSSMDIFFQAWTRSLIIIAVLIPVAVYAKQFKTIARKDYGWLAFYCITGVFCVAPIFYAYNQIGIGPATLIYYASITIATYIVGFISFNERLTRTKVASLILALVGLLLIFNLSLASNSVLGALAAVFAGVTGGSEMAYTKKLSSNYSPLLLSVYYWITVFVAYIMFSLIIGEHWTPLSISTPWLGVVIYAVASLLANILAIVGFKYVEPSIGGIVGLLEIIFGVVFGIILFHESITLAIIAGSTLIIISAALPNLKHLLRLKAL